MARRKKKSANIVLIILGIVLLIYFANYFGLFEGGTKLSTLTIVDYSCSNGQYCLSSPAPFTCPTNVDGCSAIGWMNCSKVINVDKVVLRWSDNAASSEDFAPSYIAYDTDGDKDLDILQRDDDKYTIKGVLQKSFDDYPGVGLYYRSGSEYIGYSICGRFQAGNPNDICIAYPAWTGGFTPIPTDINPVAGYEDKEQTLGITDIYKCYSTFQRSEVPITCYYSFGDQTGQQNSFEKESNPCTLGPGQTANFTGEGYGWNQRWIKYYTWTYKCDANICDSTGVGYFVCNTTTGQLSYNITYCDTSLGYVCKDTTIGAKCLPPFDTISLTTTKRGYNTEEDIIVNVNLYSQRPDINKGNVNVYLFDAPDSTIPIGTYPITNYDFKKNDPVQLEIPNPETTGTYYLTMDATYNGKTVEFEDKPYFRVSPEVSCTINIKGKTRPTPYVNNPLVIEIVTPEQVDQISFDTLKYNNFVISQIPDAVITQSQDRSFYIYSYEYTFDKAGSLDVSVHVERSDVKSQPCSQLIQVKDLFVSGLFTDLTDCVKTGDTKTFKFETKVLGEYVDTSNYLGITEPDEISEDDISHTIKRLSVGKYEFTYPYNKKGPYDLQLISTSPEYNVGSQPIPGQINVKDDCIPVECVNVDDCPAGKICSNGRCVDQGGFSNWYLIIGGLILGIIILIIIIFYSKRKQSPDINLGGL